MKSPLLVMYSGIAAGSLCILAACRRDLPSSPSRPENVLSLSAVLIDGPETVPPGGNARFSATARMSDGTTRDVTSEAVWHSSFPSVLSIDASGLARGQEPGETHLMATFNTRLTTTEVMVLPAGTYRLNGIVTESNAADAALGGAVVEVIGGSGSGLSTTTRNDGRYPSLRCERRDSGAGDERRLPAADPERRGCWSPDAGRRSGVPASATGSFRGLHPER